MRGTQLFCGEFLVGATDKGWLSCRSWEIRERIFKLNLNSTSIPRIPCDPLRCFTLDRLLRAVYQEWVNKSRCSSWDDSSAVLPSIHRSLRAQAQHAGGAGSGMLGLSSDDTKPASFSGHPHQDLLDVPDHDEDPMDYTMSSPTAASGHCPTFFIDSGASIHATGNKELFTGDYQSDSEIKEIFIADGRALRVAGVGLVTSGGTNLPRVLHVEGMTRDILVSVSQLTRDHDLRVVFEPKYFSIKELRSKRTVGQGHVKDGMYHLDHLSL